MSFLDILPYIPDLASIAAFFIPELTPGGSLWWLSKFFLIPLFLLWVFYGSLMNLRRAWKEGALTLPAKVMAVPVLIIGGALDVWCNIVVFTVITGRLPGEFLVTTRLKKYRHRTGWPKTVSDFFGRHFLNPLDHTGDHLD